MLDWHRLCLRTRMPSYHGLPGSTQSGRCPPKPNRVTSKTLRPCQDQMLTTIATLLLPQAPCFPKLRLGRLPDPNIPTLWHTTKENPCFGWPAGVRRQWQWLYRNGNGSLRDTQLVMGESKWQKPADNDAFHADLTIPMSEDNPEPRLPRHFPLSDDVLSIIIDVWMGRRPRVTWDLSSISNEHRHAARLRCTSGVKVRCQRWALKTKYNPGGRYRTRNLGLWSGLSMGYWLTPGAVAAEKKELESIWKQWDRCPGTTDHGWAYSRPWPGHCLRWSLCT